MYSGGFWRSVLAFFVPNVCPFCGRVIGVSEYWCEECQLSLPYIDPPKELPEGLDGLYVCCSYTGRAKAAILRMKRGGFRFSPAALPLLMTERCAEILPQVDIVTDVPSGLRRQIELGYAHSRMIARDIARRSKKPYRRSLKTAASKAEQKSLTRAQRFENAKDAFIAINKEYINENNILLVDDVCTTGATLSAAASLMKKNGANKVYAVTFALVVLDKNS